MPDEQAMTLGEVGAYIREAPVTRRIDEIIVHHTWRPTAKDYKGVETVRGVRRYHVNVRGWRDNGYHLMFAPDGTVWRCRPLEQVGAHAEGYNTHSVGVSYIADFDVEDPLKYAGLTMGMQVVELLLQRFDLRPANIHFHREYADKSCPGAKLNLDWYRQAVSDLAKPKLSVRLDGNVIPCQPVQDFNVTRVALRPLAEALGYQVKWDERTQTVTLKKS